MLENKLGITDQVELARVEERISKSKAKAFYDSGDIEKLEVGTFKGLSAFTTIYLQISMLLLVESEQSIFQKETFDFLQ